MLDYQVDQAMHQVRRETEEHLAHQDLMADLEDPDQKESLEDLDL